MTPHGERVMNAVLLALIVVAAVLAVWFSVLANRNPDRARFTPQTVAPAVVYEP